MINTKLSQLHETVASTDNTSGLQRQTKTDRDTDKQTDTNRQTDRQTQTDTETDTDRQTDRQTQTDRQLTKVIMSLARSRARSGDTKHARPLSATPASYIL